MVKGMDIILVKAFQNTFFHSEYKMNHLPCISTQCFHQYPNIYSSIQTHVQIQSLQHRTEPMKSHFFLSTPVFTYSHLSASQTLHITWSILSFFSAPSPYVLSFSVFPSSLWFVSHLPRAPSEL